MHTYNLQGNIIITGAPSAYVRDLDINGTEMVKLDMSWMGFLIYYKYGYVDDGVTIVAFEISYQLIDGDD